MSGYTSIWLEDFEAGQHAVYGDHHFTREAVLAFARQYDPQGFHLDDEAAAKTHFKRLSASGWHTAAACMKLLAAYHFKLRGEAEARGEPLPHWGHRRATPTCSGQSLSIRVIQSPIPALLQVRGR
jgi:acyl dehydratase